MKILSIDTASQICGVSILENNNLIVRLDLDTGRTHSENLMPMIDQAFKQTNLSLKDIDLLVCDNGPGSFTGIRIGIATVKAFCDSLNIPCIGVSSLETLAYSISAEGLIATILDCKNDNCYFALYELKNNSYHEIISPTADTLENALNQYQKVSLTLSAPSITFVGDGSVVYHNQIIKALKTWKLSNNCHFTDNYYFASEEKNLLNSYFLGLAGFTNFQKNTFLKSHQENILPLYLRKPQARRQLEEKSKNTKVSPMTISDLDDISSILTSDFDEFWSYNILKDELNAENSNYLVAKLDDQIVGFAGIKILVGEADIMNIVVKKDFRSLGIGSILLENLIQLAKEKNLTSINLEVMEENYPAIHLYQNFGFKQIGLRKNYYKNKNGLIMNFTLTSKSL